MKRDTIVGEHVVLAPLAPEHTDALRAIRASDEVARWWGPPEDGFPFTDEPGATRFAICVDGEIAGLIQFCEEKEDPDRRHASIDIFVAAAFHDRGVGTDAVGTLAGHLLDDRGHHRITIDPSPDNRRAIRCYEKVGFRRVGVMRSEWRDRATGEWRDTLFMELVRLP